MTIEAISSLASFLALPVLGADDPGAGLGSTRRMMGSPWIDAPLAVPDAPLVSPRSVEVVAASDRAAGLAVTLRPFFGEGRRGSTSSRSTSASAAGTPLTAASAAPHPLAMTRIPVPVPVLSFLLGPVGFLADRVLAPSRRSAGSRSRTIAVPSPG